MLNTLIQPLLFPPHLGFPALTGLIAGLLLILVFEVWMLVDVLTNKKIPTQHKVWWVICMFLIHPVTAIVYFFVRSAYKKSKR